MSKFNVGQQVKITASSDALMGFLCSFRLKTGGIHTITGRDLDGLSPQYCLDDIVYGWVREDMIEAVEEEIPQETKEEPKAEPKAEVKTKHQGFTVGDRVQIVASNTELRDFHCNSKLHKGGVHTITEHSESHGTYLLDDILQGWVEPEMIQPVFTTKKKLKKYPPTKKELKAARVKRKSTRRTQYRASVKRSFLREYDRLPVGKGGRKPHGSVKALCEKYNIPVKTAIGGTGWVWQYRHGGWDVEYAVAFCRKGNATMR